MTDGGLIDIDHLSSVIHYTNLIPDVHVESEVHVEILMMIIMENGVWLPWLPPLGLEVDSRVVDDAMVVIVYNHHIECYYGKQGLNQTEMCGR